MSKKIIIGITQGDTNGIGYEVILKALADVRILDMCTPIIYGSSKAFGFYKNQLTGMDSMPTNIINTAKDVQHRRINIINCVPESLAIDPGQPTSDGAKAAIIAFERAVVDLKGGLIEGLVTAPFDKKTVSNVGFNYPGHTEFLINEFGVEDGLMFLHSDNFRIGLVTAHIPFSKVPSELKTDSILSKLRVMNDSLMKDFNIVKPKLAVLGLNPHNGDKGLMGSEEETIILPAISKANEEGILTFGPYPPDGFFGNSMQYKFDAVLAMYHDQGLIPFKALAFDSGVNFTAGLPVIRTSPDHGTAFEIAGTNQANAQPMLSAIYSTIDFVRNRANYYQMRKNPLKVTISTGNGKDSDMPMSEE